MVITNHLKHAAEHTAAHLMREIKGAKAVLLSTEDGFEVASRVQNTAQVSRLSAMASSLAALGALAGEESKLGDYESMVMAAKDGLLAVLQVRRADVSLILSVIAGREAVAGQVVYFSKQAARALENA